MGGTNGKNYLTSGPNLHGALSPEILILICKKASRAASGDREQIRHGVRENGRERGLEGVGEEAAVLFYLHARTTFYVNLMKNYAYGDTAPEIKARAVGSAGTLTTLQGGTRAGYTPFARPPTHPPTPSHTHTQLHHLFISSR